jgi:23S rRNA (guanine745-N1)-methyltransferase
MTSPPITPFPALACPLDGGALQRHGTSWRCAAGHSFDIASQGYTHLLPVQNKRSRDPGDSKEMIAARRRFLETGVYQPIADAVAEATLADLTPGSTASCLDAGCGEGYYLRQLAAAATQRGAGPGPARPGHLEMGRARRGEAGQAHPVGRRQQCQPAGAAGHPRPGAVHVRLSGVPGVRPGAQKPGGLLLQVDAGPDHLRELREIIYPSLKPERPARPGRAGRLHGPAAGGARPLHARHCPARPRLPTCW